MNVINNLIEKANKIGKIYTRDLVRYLRYCYIREEIDTLTAAYISFEIKKLKKKFKFDNNKIKELRELEAILIGYLIERYENIL